MKDHLGNVRVTFSDLKLQPVQQDSFRLDLLTVNNYYPFGMNEPDRNYKAPGLSKYYRYGYNGMEKDNEIKGEGNSYTTLYRGFDDISYFKIIH